MFNTPVYHLRKGRTGKSSRAALVSLDRLPFGSDHSFLFFPSTPKAVAVQISIERRNASPTVLSQTSRRKEQHIYLWGSEMRVARSPGKGKTRVCPSKILLFSVFPAVMETIAEIPTVPYLGSHLVPPRREYLFLGF